MHDSLLFPPHHQSLSDNVIGAVVTQKSKRSSQSTFGDSQYHQRPYSIQQQRQRVEEPTDNTIPENVFFTVDAKDKSRLVNVKTSATTNIEGIFATDKNGKKQFTSQEIVNMLVLDKIAMRKRRQVIQQKYRKKIRDGEVALQDSVIQQRHQIRQLEVKRQFLLHPHGVISPTPSSIIVRYFQHFRNGFRPTISVSKLCSTSAMVVPTKAHMQAKFVQAVMTPDVMFNGGCGIEALLEDWRLISLHHEKLDLQLLRVDQGEKGFVTAYLDGVTRITSNMLRSARFDFLHHGEADNLAPITAKLLDQKLVFPTTVRFDWDDAAGRITRVQYDADMVTPLLKLLENLEDTSRVLNSTLDVHHWSKGKSLE
ncbi:hypothetical protein PHMEG_000174 [Phytophthora megakarya]|uniref:Bzip transcription factor n=1 Tax=Phytophthora megakarya TaxID=4795 RepID=A0A225X461_9STRA|nr:hypothetical protein PHMEG_000174 [Phytophthora megakarya]